MTVELAFKIKLQLFVLFDPLEQAPDQITSRPLASDSVIDVPLAKVAEPLPPTVTLMPDGFEVIRSPLRPVAVTVSVTFCEGVPPLTPRGANSVELPSVAASWTVVPAVGDVVIGKLAVVAPAFTVTLAGTLATPG